MKFTKQLKENWLNALKSGKYQKGTGSLRNNTFNTFCCIGVLCEIAPDLSISESGKSVVYEGNCNNSNAVYGVISEILGVEPTKTLYHLNDINSNDNFVNVIPIIEKIPTVD